MTKLRGRLSFANVMSVIAVFIALGGASYAATQLPKNSVGNKQLKNGSITASKLNASAKQALKGSIGPTGLQGPKGDQGDQGPSAASSFSGGGFAINEEDLYCGPTTVQAGNMCISNEDEVQNTLSALSPNAPIVARDLFVKQAGPVSGGSRTFTLRVEGTDTAVTCTLVGFDETCNSGAATATIQPGRRILLHINNPSEDAGGNGFWFGWRATTP